MEKISRALLDSYLEDLNRLRGRLGLQPLAIRKQCVTGKPYRLTTIDHTHDFLHGGTSREILDQIEAMYLIADEVLQAGGNHD